MGEALYERVESKRSQGGSLATERNEPKGTNRNGKQSALGSVAGKGGASPSGNSGALPIQTGAAAATLRQYFVCSSAHRSLVTQILDQGNSAHRDKKERNTIAIEIIMTMSIH